MVAASILLTGLAGALYFYSKKGSKSLGEVKYVVPNARLAIGSDHAGVEVKSQLVEFLEAQGFGITDVGTENKELSCDYPDYGHRVATRVSNTIADFGILICGTGVGMAMTANKHNGVRAVVSTDGDTPKMARAHNNANLICFGARTQSIEEIKY